VPPPPDPGLHSAEVRDLLRRTGFAQHSQSRKGVVYYRPPGDDHRAMVIVLPPECTLDQLVDAIHRTGTESQARHIASSFQGLLHSLHVRPDHAHSLLRLLEQPVSARHGLLSIGPLIDLERCQWSQAGM
jgi:hypothetical protein